MFPQNTLPQQPQPLPPAWTSCSLMSKIILPQSLWLGYTLANGVKKAVAEHGVIGIFTGGITAGAAGISAAIIFGFLAALIFKPKPNS